MPFLLLFIPSCAENQNSWVLAHFAVCTLFGSGQITVCPVCPSQKKSFPAKRSWSCHFPLHKHLPVPAVYKGKLRTLLYGCTGWVLWHRSWSHHWSCRFESRSSKLLIQLPVHASWGSVDDGLSAWVPVTHMGEADGVLGSWFRFGPALAFVGGITSRWKICLSVSLCHAAFQVDENK